MAVDAESRRGSINRWLLAGLGLFVGLIAGYAIGHLVGSIDLQRGAAIWTWMDGWVHSPGFAGAAAVLAAAVAYIVARVNASVQREAGYNQAQTAREDRWWDQIRWAVERISETQDPREQSVAVTMLRHFSAAAPGDDEADFAEELLVDITGEDLATVDIRDESAED